MKGVLYRMKKIISLLLCLLMLSSLTACADGSKLDEAYQGFGIVSTGRKGPGADNTETQVWSFNQVFADVIFDGEGKIVSIYIDQLEVATPNYDGAGMPHFSGFPGQGGYNYDENHDEVVDGMTVDTEENYFAEIAGWATKRERGADYVMNTGTWTDQIEKYQTLFVGKTVAEIEEWFTKYASDLNGRPLKADATKDEDIAKYATLTDDEKEMLADVTTAATMSLRDGHGDIIAAIQKAYDNRVKLEIKEATAKGFAVVSTGRKGPGADDTETQVWSFNQVFVNSLFDKDDKLVALYIDQLEVATPNYDGAGMPHFSGYLGQGGYNLDENHDGVVDGKSLDTEEAFFAEIATWATKRERGSEYVMNTGTWTDQIEKYQALFIGKTVTEIEEWFAKYSSDLNGRPLKADSTKDEDIAKYNALSDDDKAVLADVTTAATMSLRDGHGDILGAIKKSFDNRIAIELKVK